MPNCWVIPEAIPEGTEHYIGDKTVNSHSAGSASHGEQDGPHGQPLITVGSDVRRRRRRIRLSPVVAIAIAAAGLALSFGPSSDHSCCSLRKPPTVGPDEAVDISLERLVRSRVTERFKNQNRLDASHQRNRELIDGELHRIREHALYARIKQKLTDHLRNEGYERVPIRPTQDPKDWMLSADAEFTLNGFIHSLRASLPAPNEKVAAFLQDQEALFGKSIADSRGANRYDMAFTFLIQLLFEYPDDLEPIANAVTFAFSTKISDLWPTSLIIEG